MASRRSRQLEIELTPTAISSLRRVRDKKVRRALVAAIDLLATEAPRGKRLEGALTGLFSRHAASDRFRVVYEIQDDPGRVVVHLVGRRAAGRAADMYSIAARLLRELTGADPE